MVSFLTWLLGAAVGIAFTVAGIGKLVSPDETQRLLRMLGTTKPLASTITTTIPAVELAVGLALLLGWRSRLLFVIAMVLLALFCVFLFVLGRIDPKATCSCFGPLLHNWSGGSSSAAIGRNFLFAAILFWPAWRTWHIKSGGIAHATV